MDRRPQIAWDRPIQSVVVGREALEAAVGWDRLVEAACLAQGMVGLEYGRGYRKGAVP